jgi:hypothetical protein
VEKTNLMFFFLFFKNIVLYESLGLLLATILVQTIPFVKLLKLILRKKKIFSRAQHDGGFVV